MVRLTAGLTAGLTAAQHRRRACNGVPTEVFFPTPGDDGRILPRQWATAREICARCPLDVHRACEGIGRLEPEGMFAGRTPRERRTHQLAGGPIPAPSMPDRAEAVARAFPPGDWFDVVRVAQALGVDAGAWGTSIIRGVSRLERTGEAEQHRVDGRFAWRRVPALLGERAA